MDGTYGPLVTNNSPSIKQRVHSRTFGTVVRISDRHKWGVKFDYNNEIKTVPSNSLALVPTDTGIPVDKISAAFNSVTLIIASASASIPSASVLGQEVIEPTDEDTVNDAEDNDKGVGEDEGIGEDEGGELAPNNYFYISEKDFLCALNDVNEVIRHQGIYSDI